jgi:hypothetical protein
MNTYEVTVKDAAGHTFTFTYKTASGSEARAEFRRRARKGGIRKLKNVKIIEVNRID